MKLMYILRECTYEDGSGDIVFESFEGAKGHLLSLKEELEGLWAYTKENDARTAVEEWDGEDVLELLDDSFSTIFSVERIEVRP